MKAAGGEYTGNATDNRDITIAAGFGTPDLIFAKRFNGLGTDYGPWVRSSTMTGDSAKKVGTAAINAANSIQAFGTDTFQVGTAEGTNRNANLINYLAFRDDGAGGFAVFTYTGNGAGARTITPGGSFDFTPALAWLMPESSIEALWWASAHAATNSQTWRATPITTGITAVGVGSITVDTSYNVNLTVYHVAVWVTGSVTVIDYVGNGGSDVTHAHGLGVTPVGAMVQTRDGADPASVWRVTVTTAGAAKFGSTTAVGLIDLIDGTNVRVDSDNATNENTKLFTALAWPDEFSSGGGGGGSGALMLLGVG